MISVDSLSPGAILLVNFGETVGHEPKGIRPCIMISAPNKSMTSSESLDIVVVVPLTSTRRTWWTVVRIDHSKALDMTSFALCHNVQAISIERIKQSLGILDAKTFTKIKLTLSIILDL